MNGGGTVSRRPKVPRRWRLTRRPPPDAPPPNASHATLQGEPGTRLPSPRGASAMADRQPYQAMTLSWKKLSCTGGRELGSPTTGYASEDNPGDEACAAAVVVIVEPAHDFARRIETPDRCARGVLHLGSG